MIGLTLVRVHLEVEVREEQLAEVEEANVDVATVDTVSLPEADHHSSTHLLIIFSMSSADNGFLVS